MDCEQALALISSRIDREITPGESAELSEHLRGCESCRATAEAFAAQHADLRKTFEPRRAAVAATMDRVRAAVAHDSNRAKPRRLNWTWGRGLIAAAAVLLLGAWVALGIILALSGPNSSPFTVPAPFGSGPLTNPGASASAPDPNIITAKARPKADEPKPLQAGQTVTTALGERRREKLFDGSVVYLNENTSLAVDAANNVRLVNGTAYFEMANRGNAGLPPGSSPVAVSARNRTFVGDGTKFAVRCEDRSAGLLVAAGEVYVTEAAPGPNDPGLTVCGGQMLAPADATVTPAARVSHALDWTRDLVAAAEAPLVPASSYDGGALIAVDANGQEAKLSLRKYLVDVHIEDGFARTTIDQTYFNHHNIRLEGTFHFPLPPDASLSRLAMYVDGQLNEGGMVDRDYGRTVYDRIVRSQKDPALLEWVDGSTFKMRVFPLEGRQEKRIVLSYTQRVPTLYGKARYRFPAGHTLQNVRDWSFHAVVKNGAEYRATSPTHPAMKSAVADGDLVLNDAAVNCKVDRDVELDLTDSSFVAQNKDAVRFSRAELDGIEYLMMRYRPHLAAEKNRERRDWIFLCEMSADRDPLLARTQIEVIRGMLQNTERTDTVHIIAANNRVHSEFDPEAGAPGMAGAPGGAGAPPGAGGPGAAPPDTADAAGIKMLEETHLIGALDLGAAFRSAADRAASVANPYVVHVGGGYTGMGTPQDALPKLLPAKAKYIGVGVGKRWNRSFMKQLAEKTGGYYTQINPDESVSWRAFDLMATLNTPRWLNVEVADARQPRDAADAVARFLVDNNAIAQGEELCAVTRLAARDGKDDWRKLPTPERVTVTGLLDGRPYKQTVNVENVAKDAAYIPRTWAKLEIDRLLADDVVRHKNEIVELSKAMYVMSPFTSLLVLENEEMYKEYKVDRGRKDHWAMYRCPETIPVVYEPDPTMPTDVRNAPKGTKPAARDVLQTVCVRRPPRWLEDDRKNSDRPVGTAIDSFYLATEGLQMEGSTLKGIQRGEEFGLYLGYQPPVLSKIAMKRVRTYTVTRATTVTETGFAIPAPEQVVEAAGIWDGTSNAVDLWSGRDNLFDNSPSGGWGEKKRDKVRWSPDGRFQVTADEFDFDGDLPPSQRALTRLESEAKMRLRLEASPDYIALPAEPAIAWPDPSVVDKKRANVRRPDVSANPQNSLLYHRSHYTGDQRLFTDLLSYAPGLNTSEADVLAVLDAEAMPDLRQAPGRIDPEARKLIEATRSPRWRKLTLVADKERPEQVILFDATGRYFYETAPALGLRQTVACDGETLLHVYPEIGLAGRRSVTRFHRAEMAELLPWVLPPAEDLARGVDLECVADNTVALVPHWLRDARIPKGERPKYSRLDLIFDEGRLAERRLVEMPERKTLARELYDGNGEVLLLDKDGKQVSKVQRNLTDAAAPDLRPDLTGLVVLALPFRTRTHVMSELYLNPSVALDAEDNGCFEYLNDADSLTLFTALAAENQAAEAGLLYRRCFQERGDTRRGLFALLSAAGADVSGEPGFRRCFERDPDDELLRYLALCGNALYRYAQQRLPLHRGDTATKTTSLLRELSDAQALLLRWQPKSNKQIQWESRQGDVRRSVAFLGRHRRDALGLALLYEMQDRTQGRAVGDLYPRSLELAEQWRRIAKTNDGAYSAQYEYAAALRRGGERVKAEAAFKELYKETLKAGNLPPIDRRFKLAFQDLEAKAVVDDWNPLIRETGRTFIRQENFRAALALAWQCRTLGEPALTETLLADILEAMKFRPGGWDDTTLGVIDFYARTGEAARADALLRPLLAEEKLSKNAILWRAAARLADRSGQETQAIADLEKALDLEYQKLPEVIELQAWRNDYGKLLAHYQKLAESARSVNAAPPKDLSDRTVRAIDRWRAHDPEANEPCRRAAEVLALVGKSDLAWDYYTTTLIGRGTDTSPWQDMASGLTRRGEYPLADQALRVASETDPTNAAVLWERARNLREAKHDKEADELMGKLANGKWPEQYQDIHAHAQDYMRRR
jgi:ferric-dicitrate binding protein FerR (iron transport regulator)